MGVTRVDVNSLPKQPLEYNLPGGTSRWGGTYYALPIPSTTSSSEYPAWVAARKTKGFIFW
jgi:hypothetical protein